MTGQPSRLILKTNSAFRKRFHELKKGDVVSCVLNLAPGEDYILLDLVQRGIHLVPSAISQLASRSKCCQAALLLRWMHPLTTVIRKKADLVRAVERYGKSGVHEVITKLDRSDCGLGICIWKDVEAVFSQVVFSTNPPYPFVLQPFLADCTDIRVIWIGDEYREAYWRKNPASFRNNLHFGGESGSYELAPEEEEMCRAVMMRGDFPYAHMDLLKTGEGEVFFSEISLFGGLKGALISDRKANAMKQALQEKLVKKIVIPVS